MKYTIQCRFRSIAVYSLFFLCTCCIYTQAQKPALYFYSAAAGQKAAGDPAVIKMTEDLLFSQLSSLDLFILYDKRTAEYSASVLKEHALTEHYLFYAEIYEKNGEWFSKLHLIEAASGKESVLQNNYEGYYKVLMEAKNSLNALIKQFNSGNKTLPAHAASDTKNHGTAISAESLSGTWYGEEHIDKIILLRGGRGFVIFKNGASMNISVSINGKILTAVQQSKPNASFFPEIPREAALVNAPEAAPVRWELTVETASSMKGFKSSLTAEYDAAGNVSIKQGSFSVHWHR